MSVLYHPCMANVVMEALSRLSMGSVSLIYEAKKDVGPLGDAWVWIVEWDTIYALHQVLL